MKQNNLIMFYNNNPKYELLKIKRKLIDRYQIYDKYLLEELASTLKENGIGLDKFNDNYYSKPFDLDEIIYYLIDKIIKKNQLKITTVKTIKIIDFKEYTSKKLTKAKIRK